MCRIVFQGFALRSDSTPTLGLGHRHSQERSANIWEELKLKPCVLGALLLVWRAAAGGEVAGLPIPLKEQAGRTWHGELVHWPIPGKGKWHIVDSEGRAVPCQQYGHDLAPRTPLEGPGLYALVDLPARATLDWRIVPGKPTDATARVRILKQDGGIVLASDALEVRLAPPQTPTDGAAPSPIQAIRLPKGDWLGSGTIATTSKLESCTTEVLANGPLFAEAEVRYVFSGDRRYVCRVRVVAGQPVAHVTESYHLGSESWLRLKLRPKPSPDACHGIYRRFPGHLQAPAEKSLLGPYQGLLARLWPWRFYVSSRWDGSWFAAYHTEKPAPACGVFPTFPQVWTRPDGHPHDSTWYKVGPEAIEVSLDQDRVFVYQLPLTHGTRSYCLYLAPKQRFLDDQPNGIAQAKRQYGETPLQRAKDWILDWPSKAEHPHLFFGREDIPALRKSLKHFPTLEAHYSGPTRSPALLEDLTCYHLVSGSEKILSRILGDESMPKLAMRLHGAGLLPELRLRAHQMLDGFGLCPVAPNNIMWLPDHLMFRVLSADVLLGSPAMTEEQRRELRRLLAIIAYEMESPEMVPPRECRYQLGTANMPGPFYAVLGMIGALLSDHPHSRRWMARSLGELRADIHRQSLPEGTWAESYMYQERTMRAFVPAAVALARKGLPDLMNDARVWAVFRTQIASLGPVDPRNNVRSFPPIGDGTWYVGKPSIGAAIRGIAPHQPELAGELAWAWRQHGNTSGLLNPTYPYAWLLSDPAVAERTPKLRSQVLPGAAVILRSRYATPTETYLHLRAADFALSHFQSDQLSLHWHAKGAPLCLDWGYYGIGRHRPAEMHNRTVVKGAPNDYGNGQIVKTAFLPRMDYVHIRDSSRNVRVRRMLFVRGDSPTDPEYVLMRDSLSGPGRWNLWTHASGVDLLVKDVGRVKSPPLPRTAAELSRKWEEMDGVAALPEVTYLRGNVVPEGPLEHKLAYLAHPLLPRSHDVTLKPFVVLLAAPEVTYRGTFGVDLAVRWFAETDRVEMGADQWGCGYEANNLRKVHRGEHQKLLRLHLAAGGEVLSLLYSYLHEGEPKPQIEAWGKSGVKVARADGTTHYVWLSAPDWSKEGATPVARKLEVGPVSAEAEALLIVHRPDGAREVVMVAGTRCKLDQLSVQSDEVGSLNLLVRGNAVDVHAQGPARELALTLPGEQPTIRVNGEEVAVKRTAETIRFSVPAGM